MERKQELLDELNKIRGKEIEKQLIELDKTESSAVAIQHIEQAKAKSALDIECAKTANDLKIENAKSENKRKNIEHMTHRAVTIGDFSLKFLIASAVSGAFMYIVWTGSMASVEEELIGGSSKSTSLFNLLSVVGPLFGMVLSYYFGKTKSSVNGE